MQYRRLKQAFYNQQILSENQAVYDVMWKNTIQTTDDRQYDTVHALCMPAKYGKHS